MLTKARFWQRRATTPLNERQVKLLNKLLDGIEGKLTSSKWAAIAKCSPDTALRDINDLLTRGVLRKSDAGGRSTSYELNDLPVGWHPGLNSRNRNRTRVPQSSTQAVPDSTATAVLIKCSAFDQCPEMLLERVAAGPGQLDGLANGDAAVLAGELDDL